MPALTIKSIPENLYRSLKASARAHHRSINGEVLAWLERAFGASRLSPEAFLERLEETRSRIKGPKLTDRALREAKERGRP